MNFGVHCGWCRPCPHVVYHEQEGEDVPRIVIHVRVHPFVRVIRARAFFQCQLLMRVELHDGIDVIEEGAFWQCTSLCKMLIPPSVRVIKKWRFSHCSGLTTAILNNGLEEIGEGTFAWCTSHACIVIPCPKPPRYVLCKGTYVPYNGTYSTSDQGQMLDV
jgi:hypothetical protein